MKSPLLKICGIRDSGTAASAAPLPIDYIGFVFAESKRRVTPEEAWALMGVFRRCGGRQQFAGVFVNPSLEELAEVMEVAPLNVFQLHGAESPKFLRSCRERFPGVHLWKAVSVKGGENLGEADVIKRLAGHEGMIDALMLDTYDPHLGGGTGRTFRWETIPAYAAWTGRQGIPLFIAGGLDADNVGMLMQQYPIGGVDVSSGVETGGRKDMEKIRTFVKRVKGT